MSADDTLGFESGQRPIRCPGGRERPLFQCPVSPYEAPNPLTHNNPCSHSQTGIRDFPVRPGARGISGWASMSWARRSRCAWNREGSCGIGGPDVHARPPGGGTGARTPRRSGRLPASRVCRPGHAVAEAALAGGRSRTRFRSRWR